MKEPRYLEIRHETVTKGNELIQKGQFDLSLQQQKIILFLIAQISPKDEDFKIHEFSISEFCRACGIAYNGRSLHELGEALLRMRREVVLIKRGRDEDGEGLSEDDEDIEILGWIDYARSVRKAGIIKVRINEEMKPYLLQLKQRFTTYELIWTLNFRSKYTIRLYEYVKSVHYHKDELYIKDCPVDELKRIMGAGKYKTYKDFKKWALAPAVEEINQFSDVGLKFEELRQGRRGEEIGLIITPKEPQEDIRLKNAIEDKFDLNQLTIWDRLEG